MIQAITSLVVNGISSLMVVFEDFYAKLQSCFQFVKRFVNNFFFLSQFRKFEEGGKCPGVFEQIVCCHLFVDFSRIHIIV